MGKASSSASTPLQEYLKRYGDKDVEDKKKMKKKKKVKAKPLGVLVVDKDPVWAKPVKLEEDNDDSEDEEKPIVDEEHRSQAHEETRIAQVQTPIWAISDDGSGWVSVSDTSKLLNTTQETPGISPSRKNRVRNDTPSPERDEQKPDISPPRKRRARNDTPSPEPNLREVVADLSPPRNQKRHNNRSPVHEPGQNFDMSPPRRVRRAIANEDDTRAYTGEDLSPPRKGRADKIGQSDRGSTETDTVRVSKSIDLSLLGMSRRNHHPLKSSAELV